MITSDIGQRTQGYADRNLLERAKSNNIIGQFGQSRTLAQRSGLTIIFRRYNRLAAATTPLVEGVTPSGKILTKTDISATLSQFGDWIKLTDVIMDTHEDPILNESTDILGEQAGDTYDILRAGIIKSGSNVIYATGTARASQNVVITDRIIKTAVRVLKAQEAKKITQKITAGPNIGTVPVAACFVGICHSNVQPDLEACTGWKTVEEYASQGTVFDGEIGKLGEVRFVLDNNLTPWADAGTTASTNGTLTTTGTNSDVYPIIITGKDAYGNVQLAGKGAVQTLVNNPKPTTGDELAQNGSVGWKGYHAAAILNDLWMVRIETAVKG